MTAPGGRSQDLGLETDFTLEPGQVGEGGLVPWYMVLQGFPWGTKIGKSLISDLCTEIVLFWWDFYLQGQH